MALSDDKDATRDALSIIIDQAVKRHFRDRNAGLDASQILAREILERFDAMMLMSSCAFGSGEDDG